MTVIQPNSVAGINSITVQNGNSLAIHKSDGSLIRTITGSTGVTTFRTLSVGSGTTDFAQGGGINIGLGASISNGSGNGLTFGTGGDDRVTINSSGDVSVGTAATIKAGGNATFAGIVTASSFVGDGSGLTNAGPALTGSTNNTVVTVTGSNAIAGEANLTFDGNDLAISRSANSAGGISITNTNNAQGSQIAQLALSGGDNAYANINLECNGNTHHIKQDGSGNLDFINGSTKRWRIRANGHLESNNTNLYLLRSGTTGDNDICFGDSADDDIGRIRYDHDDNSLQFLVNTGEKLRVDSSGKILVGTTSDVAPDSFGSLLQIDSSGPGGSIALGRHTDSGSSPALLFHKSRSGGAAGNTIVQSGDSLGSIIWYGADGGDRNSTGASIAAEVDGTPGSNDMPGRLLFRTTADGAASSTERLRIDKTGAWGIAGANYGSSGQVLTSGGSGAAVSWSTVSGGVTSDSAQNTVAGDNAGNAGTWSGLGGNNCFGENAGTDLTGGTYNHCFGYQAGSSITTGNYNIAIGFEALKTTTTGGGNIAIGQKAINGGDVTGANNVAIGLEALKGISGNINGCTAVGYRAGYTASTTDGALTAFGFEALMSCTTGIRNCAIGYQALRQTTTGGMNTALGYKTGYQIAGGANNTVLGHECAQALQGGNSNNIIGYNACYVGTSYSDNNVMGREAMYTNTSGNENVAIGSYAGYAIASTHYNTCVGHQAGRYQIAHGATYIGWYAGRGRTTGSNNTAIGRYSMGSGAGQAEENTGVGYAALYELTSGNNNSGFGNEAGKSVTSGYNNTCLGTQAGQGNSPSGTITTGSNAVVLGNNDVANLYCADTSISSSDKRDKTDVTNFTHGLSWVNQLKPVTYRWDKRTWYNEYNEDGSLKTTGTPDGSKKTNRKHIGFLAQDVLTVEGNPSKDDMLVVNLNEDDTAYGLKYERLVPVLVNAIKELSAEVETLKTKVSTLESA